MKRPVRSNFLTIFFLFLAAVLIEVVVYPELFITFKTSFIFWDDYCVEYPRSFILTTFFYQGGLQLWNFFGQMPFGHTYVTEGLFKFSNLVTALAYYLLAPFSDDSGRLFHHVFAWGIIMTHLLIRLVGIYLLLKIVTKNRALLIIATVIFAIFFSQIAFLMGTYYMSYFPLGMYFAVRFFQSFQWRFLAALFSFFFIGFGSGVLHGAYMYLPMHFFIIAGILWSIFLKAPSDQLTDIRLGDLTQWRKTAGIILAAVLIMAPYAYIVRFGFPDLAFGQDNSRISHLFSPPWYFHKLELNLGDPRHFFSAILNFQSVDHIYYLGTVFLFLALAGIVLSRNTLKWFFGLGVLFLWLLSFPRECWNPGLIAHWINALTNPLKTIPRSYQTTCEAMLPYLLMPLAVMGIEAMMELYRGKKFPGYRLGVLGIATLALVWNGVPIIPHEAGEYLMISAALLLGTLGWVYVKNSPLARNMLIVVICCLGVIDILLIIHQSKNLFVEVKRMPIVLEASPRSGAVGYDFENPSIFPYRNSFTFHFSYHDEAYIWWPHSLSSDMHHVINQALNYTYLNGYNPRHVEFAKWLSDPEMLPYLTQNNEFIFLAQTAINAAPGALSRITSAGLARQVIEVDDPGRSLSLPDQWPGDIISKGEDDLTYDQIEGTWGDGNDHSRHQLQRDMVVYTLHLPSDFPDHLVSSWFPAEQRYLRFFVEKAAGQWHQLQDVQGELLRPDTFDVQNIRKGDLKAAFSKDDLSVSKHYVLFYPSSTNQGVVSLWRKEFDNLGLIYNAKRDGWLVAHYPYDIKWNIQVDGKPVTYYRVDKSFIGFPLSAGVHKILIQYWPHSPLRVLLLVSALLTTIGLPLLIFLALRWEQDKMIDQDPMGQNENQG